MQRLSNRPFWPFHLFKHPQSSRFCLLVLICHLLFQENEGFRVALGQLSQKCINRPHSPGIRTRLKAGDKYQGNPYLPSIPEQDGQQSDFRAYQPSGQSIGKKIGSKGLDPVKPAEIPKRLRAEGSGTPCVIKVLGIGGGGGNAVNRMISTGIQYVDFWSVNTDIQALSKSLANTLAIGESLTRGLGAGGKPIMGRNAAVESRAEIEKLVQGADMVFVTAGMGGGTGSGAAPVVAEVAKMAGCLTVGVVTKPFGFEGRRRYQQAVEAINQLQQHVDTVIVVSNDKLLEIVPDDTPVQDAFLVADDILRQGVIGISEIIMKPGMVNVDFADVRAVMTNAGGAIMGVGTANGKFRAQDAAIAAISSPLLDRPLGQAKGVVFNVVGDSELSLQEINAAADVIYDSVDPDANIIFGALVDPTMPPGEISITVLATGVGVSGSITEEFRADAPRRMRRNSLSTSQDRSRAQAYGDSQGGEQDEYDEQAAPGGYREQEGEAPLRQPLPTEASFGKAKGGKRRAVWNFIKKIFRLGRG